MSSNDNILAGISKIHAYRYAKEKQRGVKLGENQVTTTATKFTTAPIQIGTDDFSVEFYGNSFGSDAAVGYSFVKYQPGNLSNNTAFNLLAGKSTNGIGTIQVGNIFDYSVNYVNPDEDGLFHAVVTRAGTSVILYINGAKFKEYSTSGISDFGTMDFLIANSRNVGFVRVWNMCLSADDVTAHYNNGDPMGYVVPTASRYFERSYHSNFTEGTDGWKATSPTPDLSISSDNSLLSVGGNYSNYYLANRTPITPKYAARYKFRIEFEEPITISGFQIFAFSADTYYEEFSTMTRTVLEGTTPASKTGNPSANIFFYIFGLTPNTVVRIKSISIEPVGLLAEYLPQNLMESRKGPDVEPTAEIFEFNLETAKYLNIFQINNNLFYSVYRIDYTVDEWEFYPTPSQFVGFGGKPGVTLEGNIGFNTLEDAKIGEQQTFYAYLTEGAFRGVDLYAGSSQESSTTRRLKVTIKGITPMSVPISWLDSAKQLPWSDAYLPPLLQSKGGYDMVPNGAPEVLFNE